MRSRELRQKLGEAVQRYRELLEAAPADQRSAEDEATLDRLDREMDALERELARLDKQEARELEQHAGRPIARHRAWEEGGAPEPDRVAPAFRGMDLRTGREVRALLPDERVADQLPLTPEERRMSPGRWLRGIATGRWGGAEAEQRALTISDFGAGGALVPAPLAARIIDLARAQSVVVQLGAQTIPMESTTLDLARVTGDPTAAWYADETRPSGLTESQGSFGRVTLSTHTLAILERVSIELAEDAPNIASLLEAQITQALALALDRAVLYGIEGWSGLRGLPDAFGLNEVDMGTNGAALASYAPIVSAMKLVLEGNYSGSPDALGMAMAPRTWATIEGLIDSTGQPLRAPGAIERLRRLASTQIHINESHGSATNATTIFLGDWSQVLLGVRTGIMLEASREGGDAFSRLHVLFRGYLRADWTVTQPKHLSRIVGIVP